MFSLTFYALVVVVVVAVVTVVGVVAITSDIERSSSKASLCQRPSVVIGAKKHERASHLIQRDLAPRPASQSTRMAKTSVPDKSIRICTDRGGTFCDVHT